MAEVQSDPHGLFDGCANLTHLPGPCATSINMMVGFLTPSGGTALINGLDILKDMDAIYPMMGCAANTVSPWQRRTCQSCVMDVYEGEGGRGGPLLTLVMPLPSGCVPSTICFGTP